MKPQMVVVLCLVVLVRSLPFTDETGREWTCENEFYQRLATEQWAEECAGLTKSSQGVTFPSSPSFAGASAPSAEEKEVIEKLRARVARYLPKAIEVDTSYLNNTQENVLETLISAAKYMNNIFEMQVWDGSPERKEILQSRARTSELASLQLQLWDIMKGPWDRTDGHKPFAIDMQKPEGAGFYLGGLSYKEFKVWLQLHPDEKESLESPVTVVRKLGQAAQYPVPLEARPYSQAYREYLRPASRLLHHASNLTDNPSLAAFLSARAEAFLSNDYTESESLWMDLDSRVQIAIGPYEVKEDTFAGLKAAFEAFVYVTNLPEEQEVVNGTLTRISELEENLPVPEEMKNQATISSLSQPIVQIAELIYASGDAMKDIQTFAFDLPKDLKVREQKGSRKVVMKNVIEAKFDAILGPIALRIMKNKQIPMIDSDAFFFNIVFNQISRSLGPKYVGNDESRGEISKVLGGSAATLEEARADVMGIWSMLYMFDNGRLDAELRNKSLFTYITSLLRSVRFGTDSSQGKAAAVQLNMYLEENAILHLERGAGKDEDRFQVNFKKLEDSIKTRVTQFVTLQYNGVKDDVEKILSKYGVLDSRLKETLARLEDVPVDIRPQFQKDY